MALFHALGAGVPGRAPGGGGLAIPKAWGRPHRQRGQQWRGNPRIWAVSSWNWDWGQHNLPLFSLKYVRRLCARWGVDCGRREPLLNNWWAYFGPAPGEKSSEMRRTKMNISCPIWYFHFFIVACVSGVWDFAPQSLYSRFSFRI